MVCERSKKDQPTQAGKRHQHAQNSRQEGRPENEVAEEEAIGTEKYQGAYLVGSEIKEPKNIIGASHEAKDRRKQREASVHRLKQMIEEQRHGDVKRVSDEVDGVKQHKPAPANEDLGRYCRQKVKQINDTSNPGP